MARNSHLVYSGLDFDEQCDALRNILRQSEFHMDTLSQLRGLDFPDWMLVSGAIYNHVWNVLTERDPLMGIKDVDVAYFDERDLSYEAEDANIYVVNETFAEFPIPVELRNQARVHLWYEQRFGHPFSPLKNSAEMLERFASKTHSVGVRLDDEDEIEVVAPFGLDFMFSFQIEPNYANQNDEAHTQKAERAKELWPELIVRPW